MINLVFIGSLRCFIRIFYIMKFVVSKMNFYFSQTPERFEGNMRVDLDLSKFATKVLLRS